MMVYLFYLNDEQIVFIIFCFLRWAAFVQCNILNSSLPTADSMRLSSLSKHNIPSEHELLVISSFFWKI